MADTPNNEGISGWDEDGGASPSRTRGKSSRENRETPSSPARLRSDTTNPLLNPLTSPGRMREDAAPPQPNELPPDPDGSCQQAEADHPLGAHEQENSRSG